VYSIQIANISTILFIEFIYLTIVIEILSPIKYADDVIRLLSKLSTTWWWPKHVVDTLYNTC
jgi:hypothetical protein